MDAIKLIVRLFCGAVMLGFIHNAYAEKFVASGDYQIHYNAVYSMDMNPTAAQATQLPRGRNYSWVLISVRHKTPDADNDAVATVQGYATNLLGQKVTLDFTHIKETGGQYYLAPLRFTDEDVFQFFINVQPEGSPITESIRFQQRYRVDNPA